MPKIGAQLLVDPELASALGDPALASQVLVRISPRARRLSLRLDPVRSCVVLVRPKRASQAAVTAFAASKVEWIARHLKGLPPRVAFCDGAIIPYRGIDHVIRLRPDARGGVWREGSAIIVTGRPEHVPRRIKDWLKQEARRVLLPIAEAMAAQIDTAFTRLSVRDTRSRWGSCSRNGRLSFSWRLILTPDPVLTYVAAHEIAHLRHLNHGQAYWRLLARLLQGYATPMAEEVDVMSARQWLRRSGAALHRYG